MRQSGKRKKRRFGYPPEPDTETLPGTETSEDRGIPGTEYMASETAPNGPFGRGPQHAASSRTDEYLHRIRSYPTVVQKTGKPCSPPQTRPISSRHLRITETLRPPDRHFPLRPIQKLRPAAVPFSRKFPQDKPFARFRTNGPKIRGFIDWGSAFRPSRIVCRSRRHAPRRKPSPSACAQPSPFTARADCIPVFRCR